MKEIRNILKTYENLNDQNTSLALACVVNVEESSYRRIGARMLVSSNGQWTGGISGGCLEGDALQKSQEAIYKNKPSLVVYDTMDDDKNQIGIGLGCNGRIEVLFTPLKCYAGNNVIDNLKLIEKNKDASVLLKIIECDNNKDLLGHETIANDSLNELEFCSIESQLLKQEIQKTRIKRRPQVVSLKNKHDIKLRILVEYIRPETKLVIVGDNYDVLALMKLAKEVGWELHIVGRKKKMSKAIFHLADYIYEYEEYNSIPKDEYTAIALMTHDFNWDLKLLPQFLKMNIPYIGMLGPRKRKVKMNEELVGLDLENFSNLNSPVGLDIGAETPEEIAISIIAEIIAVHREREGQFLKYRIGTIHNRH